MKLKELFIKRLLPSFLLMLASATASAQDMLATPLTLEAVEAGTINIVNPNGLTIEYNKNAAGWTAASSNPISISVDEGDAVQFRGDNASYLSFGDSGEQPTRFTATNPVYLYGNVMSLINSTGFATLKELTDKSEWGTGSNFAYLFSTPGDENGGLFPKANTTIRNHPTKDILLPATTLTPNCYMYMFSGCAALTRSPELPATTLADGCYHRLFDNCTSLETAPTLPAKRLAGFCYSNMFAGCTSLKSVKCLATDISADLCFEGWMEGVPAGGTFVKASTNNRYESGFNGIPEGWTVQNATEADGDMGATPLTMEAIADGIITISNPRLLRFLYKKNNGSWTQAKTNPISIDVVAGDKVQFKALNPSYSNEGSDEVHFTSSADCYLYGNVMSLINETTFTYNTALSESYAFAHLFANEDLSPNTTLKSHPYNELVLPATTLKPYCYCGMFNGCTGLTTAPQLPATTLVNYCYDDMFSGCTGLTEAPQLPATTLATGCYTMMFYGCTSLTKAPDLTASIVPANAYEMMFGDCSNLSYVKCLATALGNYATMEWLDGVASTGTFVKMSQMCDFADGVGGIPEGWTTQGATEADGDYGATPLTLEAVTAGTITISNPNTIPVHYSLVKTDGSSQYRNNVADALTTFDVEPGDRLTFRGNGSTNAYGNITPGYGYQIKSTADVYAYGNVMSLTGNISNTVLTGTMNFACLFGSDNPADANTTIKSHPTKDLILGATTLTESCYAFMFGGCQGLTRAPQLPATELAPICYHRMFLGCTGLTAAPVLPAPTLATECYDAMFDGCSSLNYVKCLATDLGENNTSEWLNGVAAKGIFIKADGAEWTLNSANGIPAGWSTTDTPLTIEATEDETTVTINNPLMLTIEYSTDGGANWEYGVTNSITISGIAAGGTVQLRGYNETYSSDGTAANSMGINADKDYYLYGNIMSLIDADNYASLTTLTGNYAFARLFRSSSHLKNHPTKELQLPATSLSANCYRYTFQNCTGLTKAPVLPATKMAEACYFATFIGCTALTEAPELHSTNLAPGCYTGMFANSGLTTAPVLPATELAERCYYQMFYGCQGLTTAPALPAMNVPRSGYNQMFYGCSKLAAIPNLPATTVYGFGYNMMFRNCTSLTTYPTIAATTLIDEDGMQGMFMGCTNLTTAGDLCVTTMGDRGCQYMFSGCTKLTKAPALPATKLAPYCYNRMFENCTSLVDAPALPATELADLCYNDMFWRCTSLKNAPELPATTLADYCYTMMFVGCSSMETAPVLPAVTLTPGCYEHMFVGCTSLNYVKCLATDLGDESSTDGWLTNVAANGTFVKAAGTDWTQKGTDEGTWSYDEYDEPVATTFIHGIPEGWTVNESVRLNADGEGYYWATYYNGTAGYTADESTTVYTAKVSSDLSEVELTEVDDKTIPAGNAVVLKSTAATATMTYADAATGILADNDLQGSDTNTPTPANTYMLVKGSSGVGFYHWTGTSIPAGRAYLTLPNNANNRLFIPFADTDMATGISLTPAVTDRSRQDDTLYDLSGRKVADTNPAPGIYVKNGKKVLVK